MDVFARGPLGDKVDVLAGRTLADEVDVFAGGTLAHEDYVKLFQGNFLLDILENFQYRFTK